MKTLKILSIIVCTILFLSCKKESPAANTSSTGSSTVSSLVVDSILEKTDLKRIYTVTLRLTETAPYRDTLVSVGTCTTTILGDTLVQNNIPGKLYLFSFSNSSYRTLRAYTYSKNNIWFFMPLVYNPFLSPLSIPMPASVNQRWGIHVDYHDTLNIERATYINTPGSSGRCLQIDRNPYDGMVDYEDYNYNYYFNSRGIVKIVKKTMNLSPNNNNAYIQEYQFILTSIYY